MKSTPTRGVKEILKPDAYEQSEPGAVLRGGFAGLRNAPLPLPVRGARSFGARLEPRYIFGAGQLIDQ